MLIIWVFYFLFFAIRIHTLGLYKKFGITLQPPLFDLKIVYSYWIEVSEFESNLGLHSTAQVSEIFGLPHGNGLASGNAIRRPRRHGHVNLYLITPALVLLICNYA